MCFTILCNFALRDLTALPALRLNAPLENTQLKLVLHLHLPAWRVPQASSVPWAPLTTLRMSALLATTVLKAH